MFSRIMRRSTDSWSAGRVFSFYLSLSFFQRLIRVFFYCDDCGDGIWYGNAGRYVSVGM